MCLCGLAGGLWASADATGVVIVRRRDGVSGGGLRFRSPVHALAPLPGGLLAVGTQSGAVYIHARPQWGVSPALVRYFVQPRCAPVLCIVGLAHGDVVSAGTGGTLVHLSGSTGATPSSLAGHTSRVRALLQMADGTPASASRDTTVRLWGRHREGGALRCRHVLRGHTAEVVALAELSRGALASGSVDTDVRLWCGPQCTHVLRGHASPADALAVLPSGVLASGGRADVVRLWV